MSDRVRLAEIREEELDVAEVLAALDEAGSGGVNIFVGRVRDHDDGKFVHGLDYTAHPSAPDRLREVCVRVATEHQVQALAALKAEVPIWKHQIFADGSQEWVGTP